MKFQFRFRKDNMSFICAAPAQAKLERGTLVEPSLLAPYDYLKCKGAPSKLRLGGPTII